MVEKSIKLIRKMVHSVVEYTGVMRFGDLNYRLVKSSYLSFTFCV